MGEHEHKPEQHTPGRQIFEADLTILNANTDNAIDSDNFVDAGYAHQLRQDIWDVTDVARFQLVGLDLEGAGNDTMHVTYIWRQDGTQHLIIGGGPQLLRSVEQPEPPTTKRWSITVDVMTQKVIETEIKSTKRKLSSQDVELVARNLKQISESG